MWEINNASQIQSFLYAAVLGCIYCVIYDFLRAVRLTGKASAISVFIEDIIFSVICALSCFCFLLSVTNGDMRAYILIGIACGFLAFRLTISKLLLPLLKKIIKLLRWLYKKFNWLNAVIFRAVDTAVEFLFKNIKLIFNNGEKCFKKLLKKGRTLLYTSHNR